jgi:hypothetical protein
VQGPTRHHQLDQTKRVLSGSLEMIGVEEIQINTGQPQQKRPLLPLPVAHVISTAAMGVRISLRMTYLITNSLFHTTKLSIKTSFGVGRSVLLNAVSSALALHQLASRSNNEESKQNNGHALIYPENSSRFLKVLDQYTSTSIYTVNACFSLAELLTLTGFHLFSTTINFSLEMAEECVTLFDGLFGETDTSKALAGVIQIFYHEIQGQDDALGLTERYECDRAEQIIFLSLLKSIICNGAKLIDPEINPKKKVFGICRGAS